MFNNLRRDDGIDSYVENMRIRRDNSSTSRNRREFSRSHINQSYRIGADYKNDCYMNNVNNERHKPRNFPEISQLDAKFELDYHLAKRKLLKAQGTGRFENSANGIGAKHIYEERNPYPNERGDYYQPINQSPDYIEEYNQYLREHENPEAQYKHSKGDYAPYSRIQDQKQKLSNPNEKYHKTTEFDEDNNRIEYGLRIWNASKDVDYSPYGYERPNSKNPPNTYNFTGNKFQRDKKLPIRPEFESFGLNEDNDTKLIETANIQKFKDCNENENIGTSQNRTIVNERQSSGTFSLMNRCADNRKKLHEKLKTSNVDITEESTSRSGKAKCSEVRSSSETLKSETTLGRSNQSEKTSTITVQSKKVEDIIQLNRIKSKTLSVIDDGIQKLRQCQKECDKLEPETPSKESVQSQTENPPLKSISSAAADDELTSGIIPEICKELRKYQMQTMRSKLQLMQYLEELPEKINEHSN